VHSDGLCTTESGQHDFFDGLLMLFRTRNPVGNGAEVLHEIFSQKRHGRRIEEERALSREPDDASLWIRRIQLPEFLVMQIADLARASVCPSK